MGFPMGIMEKKMETMILWYTTVYMALSACLLQVDPDPSGGIPKLGVNFLGVAIIRIIVFGGLYWGPSILGNDHIGITYGVMC